jgi:hypothetical protein
LPAPRRRTKCSYSERGRRCPFDGDGDPPLCRSHRIALAATAVPKAPAKVIADALVDLLQGRPINRDATIGAAEDLISRWTGMGAPGQAPFVGHIPPDGVWTRPSNAPPPPRPPPPPSEDVAQQLRARRIMGFSPREVLTEAGIKARKRELNRRYHTDVTQGADPKQGAHHRAAAINAAADLLLASLAR